MKLKTVIFAILILCVAFLAAYAQYQPMDRIVAIIDDEIILYSELLDQVNQYLIEAGAENPTAEQLQQLRKEMLESMIDDKILVKIARSQEGIMVDPQEVEQTMERQLETLKSQFPSEEAFQQELQAQGFTIEGLKETYREDIEDQLYKQKLVSTELRKDINVTNEELRQFYEDHKDEIPATVGEQVEVAHILFAVEPTEASYEAAAEKIAMVKNKLEEGNSFEELAKEYSDDPASREKGGDLGFFKLNDMVPEFSEALLEMNPGEVSDVVESRFGFHLIKFVEKDGDQYHAKHILAMVQVTDQEIERMQEFANTVRDSILAGADFSEMARRHSDDPESAERGGSLGVFELDKMDPLFRETLKEMEAGEISEVVESNYGFHILKLLDKQAGGDVTFEDVKDRLREALIQEKMAEKYESWVKELRKDFYIENRLEDVEEEQQLIREKRGRN